MIFNVLRVNDRIFTFLPATYSEYVTSCDDENQAFVSTCKQTTTSDGGADAATTLSTWIDQWL